MNQDEREKRDVSVGTPDGISLITDDVERTDSCSLPQAPKGNDSCSLSTHDHESYKMILEHQSGNMVASIYILINVVSTL